VTGVRNEIWLSRRLTPNDAVVAAEVDQQAILLHVDTGVYYGLDEVGTRIWSLLSDGHDTPSVLSTLAEEYDVDPTELHRDVSTFLDRMLELGLIQTVDS
jgi:hypothetical protein